ncbi:MAG: hypothetical protein UT34_C0001G0281 [candidate division WS6 bacterium GW2011_GWF2_39_15]|uniref:Uncharacterized protein n=1 Tax=candidate division WS6 bacterium GW2011_GWF2_39_15 TaxID=1619100 RepID=A0A0G0N093_9BACT|nr:MAG: hypothetical protein UT34_C0001G0281 [candidate division WS6 bacterium GW2011_GWF2_39_15]
MIYIPDVSEKEEVILTPMDVAVLSSMTFHLPLFATRSKSNLFRFISGYSKYASISRIQLTFELSKSVKRLKSLNILSELPDELLTVNPIVKFAYENDPNPETHNANTERTYILDFVEGRPEDPLPRLLWYDSFKTGRLAKFGIKIPEEVLYETRSHARELPFAFTAEMAIRGEMYKQILRRPMIFV